MLTWYPGMRTESVRLAGVGPPRRRGLHARGLDTEPLPGVAGARARRSAHALAFLLAGRIANAIADEVAGEDLVMAHGHPRNPDQAALLSAFVETLLDRGFSLRAVLEQILLNELANRRAPIDPSTSPYSLPMLPSPRPASARAPRSRRSGGRELGGRLRPRPQPVPDPNGPVCLPGEVCGADALTEVYTELAIDLGWD
jgi:hypothetical protein